jgi:hypothetical protein
VIRSFYWHAADFKSDPLFRKALEDAWWEGFSSGDPHLRERKRGEGPDDKDVS